MRQSKPAARILIVDDDATALALMRAALKKSGFDVSAASSGQAAFDLFDATPFDMVMLDVDMPEMSGYQVCTALRLKADPLLPIVMVTGLDDISSVEAAYHSGATDFIAKPFNWALIGHRVKYLMRSRDASLALRAANANNAAILRPFCGLCPICCLRWMVTGCKSRFTPRAPTCCSNRLSTTSAEPSPRCCPRKPAASLWRLCKPPRRRVLQPASSMS